MTMSDVVIVGGGPVGMGLAIDLGQRGLQVTVLEKYHRPQPVPKGQNLTGRTMEIAAGWGIAQRLRELRTTDPAKNTGGLVSWGHVLSGHQYEWLNRGIVRDYYDEANQRLPQYLTEAALRERVAALPNVSVMYGTEYIGFEEADGGCRVKARSRDTGEELTTEGRYVVACDGSRSQLREDAGIPQDIENHDKRMALIVFRSEQLNEVLGSFSNYSIFNNLSPEMEGYWQFLGRVDDAQEWFFHTPVRTDHDYTKAEIAEILAGVVGQPFDIDLIHQGYWDLRFALATRYRRGRVFIAGDAAHSHPPYGGYGINSGLEDARNLGWKLEAVIKGWAYESLLDTYDFERRQVFRSTVDNFIRKSIEADATFLAQFSPEIDLDAFSAEMERRRLFSRTEVEMFAPHYRGSSLSYGSSGAPSAVGSHDFEPRVGAKLARHPDYVDPGPLAAVQEFLVISSEALTLPKYPRADVKWIISSQPYVAGRLLIIRPDGYVALNENSSDPKDVVSTYFQKIGYLE